MEVKKEFKYIDKIFRYLQLEPIEEMGLTVFLGDEACYIKTSNNQYLVKVVKEDDINEKNYSENKINRIKALEKFDSNGVHSIFPMRFNDKYFICYRNREYEIYGLRLMRHLQQSEITDRVIKKVATNQAIMHNIKINLELPCNYREIKFDFEKILKKLRKISNEGYDTIYDNIYRLDDVINLYNNKLKYATNNLIVGYDNYDIDNIEWIEKYMFIVDYRNCNKINPAVSLAESAYSFSLKDGNIDEKNYTNYLKYYLKRFGPLTYDYKDALIVSLNKKLALLEDTINLTIKEKVDYGSKISAIVKEILSYNEQIDKLYNVYIDAVKKKEI